MLYIQQSLNPNEEIIRVGQFHWWYTFSAALNILFGVIGLIGILYAGYYWEVFQTIKTYVPDASIASPNESGYWDAAVEYRGGVWGVFQSMHWGVKLAGFLVFLMSVYLFAQKMVIKATTEICITTDRLVLKRGLVSRHVAEINVDRIEGVDVFQGIAGRIMNFGYIAVRGMGVGEISLPQIANPIDFRKAIERSRAMKRDGNVN